MLGLGLERAWRPCFSYATAEAYQLCAANSSGAFGTRSQDDSAWRNNRGSQAGLREVRWIQSHNEVSSALLRAQAEFVVSRIRRECDRFANLDILGALSNQIDNRADQAGPDAKTIQDFLILIQNILGDEPDKAAFRRPRVKNIGAWISTRNIGLSKTGDACNQNARINNNARTASLTLPARQ